MNISPDEAEAALATIRETERQSRRSFASGGAYVFLIITGVIWLIGFLSTQFLSGPIVAYIWTAISVLGAALSIVLGARRGSRVRGPSVSASARRAGLFWLLLILYAGAVIAVVRPTDGKQVTTLIILFTMIGQLAMGLLLSFSAVWWALPITALALIGYFLFPGIFYLWMGVLGGGGMIGLALYIRRRW